jgi:XTP/dITP diphosphohydrolase
MSSTQDPRLKAFQRLLNIMDDLRAECPWDKKQTMESLRHLTIEETYELSEAILEGNMEEIRKELGDIMLHLVFYAKIASETNRFNITDVLNGISDKLVRRHPHIYGDVDVRNEDEVKANWERIKLSEKAGEDSEQSVFDGVPNSMPSMVKASRIQDKARGVGFDWERKEQVWEKVVEELEEFKKEADAGSDKTIHEFGDVLFSLVNYARFLNINPDDALELTNKKFIRRFKYLEKETKKVGRDLADMSLEEMDVYWNKAKEMEQ